MTPQLESVLRKHLGLADIWEKQAQKTEGGSGLAVGAGNIDYRWKADALRKLARAIWSGADPNATAEAVRAEAHNWIAKHNARRPKDMHWQRWGGCVDTVIESLLRDVLLVC